MLELKEAIRRLTNLCRAVGPAQQISVSVAQNDQVKDSLTDQLSRRSRTTSHYNLLDLHKAIDLAG
jgi:hypothetical protein